MLFRKAMGTLRVGLLIGALLVLNTGSAHAMTHTWTGALTTDWGTAGNWMPAGVPGITDVAIINSGTVDLGGLSRSVGELNLNAGTLQNGTMTLAGSSSGPSSFLSLWTGGIISCTFNVGSASNTSVALKIDTSTNFVQVETGAVINNSGTITWVGTQRLQGNPGSLFNNLNGAAFTLQNDANMPGLVGGGGIPIFTNNGTLTKMALSATVGTGTSTMAWRFLNSGTVNVQSGILQNSSKGSAIGTFNVAAVAPATSATFDFASDFVLNAGANFTGSGHVRINESILTLNSNVTVGTGSTPTHFDILSGTLQGSGILMMPADSVLTWSGGYITNTVSLAAAAGGFPAAQLNIDTSSNAVYLEGGIINNSGVATWSGSNFMRGVPNSQFNNLSGAVFTLQNDASLIVLGGNPAFTNSGTFNKTGSSGTSTVNWVFNNSGVVNAQSGTVNFVKSFTQTAGSTDLNGGNLQSSTTFNVNGGSVIGSGTLTGDVANGGTFSPGHSPGIISETGNYSQASGGALTVELNGTTPGTLYDQLNVTGTVSLAGTLNLRPNFKPAPGTSFVIISNDGTDAVSGTFANLQQGTLLAANGVLFQISYNGGDSNDVTLTRVASPTISMNDVAITEGTGTNKNAVFTVTLSFASPQTVSVNAITANGTAKSPADYTGGGKTLTFASGQTSKTFSVPVIGDTLDEDNETFFVLLSSPVNATVLRARGVCTINDNDAPPSITIEDVNIGEGNGGQRTAVFRLHLSAPSGKLVKVNYATATGATNPAVAGIDYVAVSATEIAFTTGQTVTLARVLINGDVLNELNETFKVNLSAAINASIADAQANGTILNDDTAPALSINDVSIAEGNSGTKNLTFTVSLSAPSGQTVTVNYNTADGVARSTSDYVAKTGTLTFAAGQTSKTVSIVINGDALVEGNETLFVFLTGAVNASVAKARGVGTITNDDGSG